QRTAEPWKQPTLVQDGREITYPRRAGLSSFGATGSNAHLIIEEYVDAADECSTSAGSKPRALVVPLSAKSEQQLNEYVRKLIGFLRRKEQQIDLTSLAYTLQMGRIPLEMRVAFVAQSADELMAQMEAFVAKESPVKGCFSGDAKQGKESLSLLTADDDAQELVRKWLTKGKAAKVAE